MSTNEYGIAVIGTTTSQTVTEDDLIELEDGEGVVDYQATAITSEGVYGAPGNAAEAGVAQALGLDQEEVKVRSITYDEDANVSATAPRCNEKQARELADMVDSPFQILGGEVQERQESSVDEGYGSIDRIE